MRSYLENIFNKFVIATLEMPTRYLIFKNDNISFTKHIANATKTVSKKTAQTIKNDFYAYTGLTDLELIILPIKISYEIIQEDEYAVEGECL